MRQRRLRFIGPEAHRVAIHTFHCLRQLIIQENSATLGHHDLEAATNLDAEEVVRELLDGLPTGHPLRRDLGSAYYDLPYLQRLFQTMKREGWVPDQMLAALEEYRLGLTTDPGLYLRKPAESGAR